MKTLIVGLGNPILGDDGVGWKIVEKIEKQLTSHGSQVDVDCVSVGGIGLMEHLIGYDRVILVDAFISNADIGSVSVMNLEQLPNYSAYHITSTHDTSLQNAIEFGRAMGAHLPKTVTVVGIAIRPIRDFGEELSPPVAQAVPQATQIVMNLLEETAIVNKGESHLQG